MLLKHILLVIGLSAFLTACSTPGFDTYPNNGQPETLTHKGMRYLLGRGVPQNNAKAFAYFKEAAEQGDAFAQNEVAYLYAAGKGTAQNYQQAVVWYQKAAGNGLASAQYNLGLLYLHGLGTPVNQAKARLWFEKSANHGFEPAKQALARLN